MGDSNCAELLKKLAAAAPEGGDLTGKTLLVTGASGQIGLNVIAFALARGARVAGLYNRTPVGFSHSNLEWIQGDLTAPESLRLPQADALIHCAAIWWLPDALPFMPGIGRVIAFGSTSVFGKQESGNAAEQEVVGKLRGAEGKLFRIAADKNLRLTIMRPTMIYGMGMDANITRMARMIKKFGFIPVASPAAGLRQPVHAADLAEAALAAFDRPATFGKSYNLGGGKPVTYRAMVEALFVRLDKKPRIVPLPFLAPLLDAASGFFPFLHINGEVARRMNRDLVFDSAPAVADFGYHPRAFLEGEVIL